MVVILIDGTRIKITQEMADKLSILLTTSEKGIVAWQSFTAQGVCLAIFNLQQVSAIASESNII